MTTVVVTISVAFLLARDNSFAFAKQFAMIIQVGDGGPLTDILVSFLQI